MFSSLLPREREFWKKGGVLKVLLWNSLPRKFQQARYGTSPFSYRHTCTPNWTSVKPLEWSNRTGERFFDEVVPKISGSNAMQFSYEDALRVYRICHIFQEILTNWKMYFGGSYLYYGGHSWIRVSINDHRIDKSRKYRVSVDYHTNFHSSSIKQGMYSICIVIPSTLFWKCLFLFRRRCIYAINLKACSNS